MGIIINLLITTYGKGFLEVSSVYSSKLSSTIEATLKYLSSEAVTYDPETKLLDVSQDNSALNIYYWAVVNYSDIKYGFAQDYKSQDDPTLSNVQLLALKNLKYSIEHLDIDCLKALMGVRFTMKDLFDLFNCSKDKTYDKGNFYKLMKNHKILKKTTDQRNYVSHRPPVFYEFR